MAPLRRGVLSGGTVKNVTLGRLRGGLRKEECKSHGRARQSRAHLLRLLEKLTKRGKAMDFEMCESLHSTIYTEERTTPKHATQQRGREGVTRAQADYQRKPSRLTGLQDKREQPTSGCSLSAPWRSRRDAFRHKLKISKTLTNEISRRKFLSSEDGK